MNVLKHIHGQYAFNLFLFEQGCPKGWHQALMVLNLATLMYIVPSRHNASSSSKSCYVDSSHPKPWCMYVDGLQDGVCYDGPFLCWIWFLQQIQRQKRTSFNIFQCLYAMSFPFFILLMGFSIPIKGFVATLTLSSWLNVECKGPWSQESVFKCETHSQKWGRMQGMEPNNSQVHSHFRSCTRAWVVNV